MLIAPTNNAEIARVFQEIADLLRIKKDNIFKIRAYEKVARSVGELREDLGQLVGEGRLKEIPGAGDAIAKKIAELVTTGKLGFYERLKAEMQAKDENSE